MMLRKAVALSIAAIVTAGVGPTRAAGDPVDVPTSIVVDPCRYHSGTNGSITSEAMLMDLPLDGLPLEEQAWTSTNDGSYRGAAWSTVPGYEQRYLFVSRGPYIEVFDLDTPLSHPGGLTAAVRVVDIGALAGISGLDIGRIAAGRYLPIVDGESVYQAASLYVIGTAGSTGRYVVIDQEWLIDGQAPSSTYLYGTDRICIGSGCVTLDAIDVAVGDLGDAVAGYSEEAYVTALQDFSGLELAMTYRLERSLSGDQFAISSVMGYPWGTPAVPASSGLIVAEDSHDAFAVRKPNAIHHLVDHTETCALGGEPTDVAIWEPGTSAIPRYLVVTTASESRGHVRFVPAESCANGGAEAFSIPTGQKPAALDLYVLGPRRVLVIVAIEGATIAWGRVQSFVVELDVVGGADVFSQTESRSYDVTLPDDYGPPYFSEVCPSEVVVGVRRGFPGLPPRGLDRNCLPDDPRCPQPPPDPDPPKGD